MKKLVCVSLCLLLAIGFAGCGLLSRTSGENGSDDDKINVVTTIFPEYDFARAVVGDKADLTMLVSPGTEIHSYEPSPADIIKVQDADVFIYIGGESDVWADTILESMDTSHKRIVRLMESVTPVEEEIVEGMQAEEEPEETGTEEEVEYDEHIWTSPKNAVLMVNAIADAICEADAANSDYYRKNAESYVAGIEKLDEEIKDIVDSAANKILIFGDRFPFRYFADEFGLEYRAAFNGCSTETEASAGTIAYLVNTMEEKNLSHVFYIELSNQNIARSISEQTGAEMLLLQSCEKVSKTDFDAGATYLSLMEQNAQNLRKGLN